MLGGVTTVVQGVHLRALRPRGRRRFLDGERRRRRVLAGGQRRRDHGSSGWAAHLDGQPRARDIAAGHRVDVALAGGRQLDLHLEDVVPTDEPVLVKRRHLGEVGLEPRHRAVRDGQVGVGPQRREIGSRHTERHVLPRGPELVARSLCLGEAGAVPLGHPVQRRQRLGHA